MVMCGNIKTIKVLGGKEMERLSDLELLETYNKAKELKCSPDFILLLLRELHKRRIRQSQVSELLLNS
jgi:hypothetical protein